MADAYNQRNTKTNTYTDDQGRRRVDRDGTHKDDNKPVDPKELQQQVKSMEAELKATKSDLAKLKADFESLTIEGPGMSGSGKGISFNPTISATPNCSASPPTLTITLT